MTASEKPHTKIATYSFDIKEIPAGPLEGPKPKIKVNFLRDENSGLTFCEAYSFKLNGHEEEKVGTISGDRIWVIKYCPDTHNGIYSRLSSFSPDEQANFFESFQDRRYDRDVLLVSATQSAAMSIFFGYRYVDLHHM